MCARGDCDIGIGIGITATRMRACLMCGRNHLKSVGNSVTVPVTRVCDTTVLRMLGGGAMDNAAAVQVTSPVKRYLAFTQLLDAPAHAPTTALAGSGWFVWCQPHTTAFEERP